MREQILYYALRYGGEWKAIANALRDEEQWMTIKYEGNFTTIMDVDYPHKLHQLQNPPWILFYDGDLSLCADSGVAIVGSRECSTYGSRMCKHVVDLLKEKHVIVSGLAKGVDAIAHHHAQQQRTIGIIGCGLDIVYPKCNQYLYEMMKKDQLILSEYPNGTKPLAYHFPWRNRLIAALSDAVIVIEASKRSGTMLTVNAALELDIPVYCIPHEFFDSNGIGCNFLISQGANILIDNDDILNIFHK